MKSFNLIAILICCCLVIVSAQEDDDDKNDVENNDLNVDDKDADEKECEEAWNYLEFLKTDVKESIESILQDTLFESGALPEKTVADAMGSVLQIRDALLQRTKVLRTGNDDDDDGIKICPQQGIRQEEFLGQLRADVMTVLLLLIEPEAAAIDNLREVGRQLLNVRTKVNGKITQLIMLRETSGGTISNDGDDDCDCGILGDVVAGLDAVIGIDDDDDDVVFSDEDTNDAEDDDEQDDENETDPVIGLTMVLMSVDAQVGLLYNDILGQLNDERRLSISGELLQLKGVSGALNEILSDLSGQRNEAKLERIVSRDVVRVRNDVDRMLAACRSACPTECESCGADKIDEVLVKMADYNVSIATLEEEEAKESVRANVMQYLSTINEEMTTLLTTKIETGELNKCDSDTLEVIKSVKGPLWMLTNITIFGDADTMNEMISALDSALTEMRGKYCTPDTKVVRKPQEDNQCDLEEINNAGQWISDIDSIIQDNLFKTVQDDDDDDDKVDDDADTPPADDGRVNAMLGFVELKSSMHDRVKQLFQDNLVCAEEVDQIKNVYSDQVTECLAEMMNPKYRFEQKSRGERVQCIKLLRVAIEDRRGQLLLREIEERIKEQGKQE